MSNTSSSSLSSFTHSPARLRLVSSPRQAADKNRRGPALRTFGAANLFVVTAENLELADALYTRRRREQEAFAQANRLARRMQLEIERRSARERAGRLRLVVPADPAASPAVAAPAAAIAGPGPVEAPSRPRRKSRAVPPGVWARVRNMARL